MAGEEALERANGMELADSCHGDDSVDNLSGETSIESGGLFCTSAGGVREKRHTSHCARKRSKVRHGALTE